MGAGTCRWRRKKKLNCGIDDPALHERGRRVYNARCYFCHGYRGDASTAAAALLTPPPRDFTNTADLTPADIRSAVVEGRTGTAMQSFRGILSEQEVVAIAEFVAAEFVRCRFPESGYHTAENGWPDHRKRYGKAFPFAQGELSPDAPPASLSPDEQQGLLIFRQGCITCHFATPARKTQAQHEDEEEEYEEYGRDDDGHDASPLLSDLTQAERRGKVLYVQNCAYCHAADGTGRNAIGRFLRPHPPDFGSPALRHLTQDLLAQAIIKGKPASSMPAFESVLSGDDAAAIAAYVRRAFMAH